MKIAIVGVEASRKGGVERYTYELTRLLGAELFATSAELGFHRIPSLRGLDILHKTLFPVSAQLLIKASKFEIIHSQGASYLTPQISTAHTSQFARKRLLNQRELFLSMSWLRKTYWQLRIAMAHAMERYIYGQSIPIIAVSNLLKTELVNGDSIPADRIHVVYHGVDLEEFKPDPDMRKQVRKSLGLEGPVLVFVGNQWGRKGLKFLLEAMEELESFTLLVAGWRREEMNTVKRSPANVRFLGRSDDLCGLYNAADIFVLPSLFDSFGLPVLEAMACGVPVVVSRFAGASEIVGDAGIIIDNPRAPQEIREKILIANSRKEEMGNKARVIAEDYSWDRMVRETREVYSRVTRSM
jgi:UDP-glucose:(heptosyl)LPS alpha-1,3-glucosyltransferase